jgi:diaminohydroxyphosphoribosylaminopyrimidine deaminase/5-amino-6-(5-phosphoribosylamino)uracil reductase
VGVGPLDDTFMRLALDEARKGSPSPNPPVGAVIVPPGSTQIVGRGFHPRPGKEHAEVGAIREAGERARGATLYVTLEPCNHHGRTPPCTEAVLAAGIARVVVGVRDPNPHVTGEGNARLRAAGVVVTEGVMSNACTRLLAPWSKHVRTGLPWVRVKLAASIDGRIAAPGGVSKWITGADARRRVHALRASVDAVAVGIGTALADDPDLTPRDAARIEARDLPTRIVFDANLRLPIASRLATSTTTSPVWIVGADDAPADARTQLEARGVRIVSTPRTTAGRIDLVRALERIGAEGIVDLLVEGGAHLAGALVEQDLVDELVWFVAPIALGADGAPALIGPSPASPDVARRFRIETVEKVGDDLEIVLRRREG